MGATASDVLGLITASLLVLGTSTASALTIDARIAGVFTDTTFTTPVAGAAPNAGGDVYNFAVQTGQGVVVEIDIANPEADLLSAIFVSMIVQSEHVGLLGAIASPEILTGGTFLNPTSLVDINSGSLKSNAPGPPGEVWIQAVSYADVHGSNETGPEVAAVQLFFEVLSGGEQEGMLLFDLQLTDGDVIEFANSTTFSGALITVMPEPGTALLLGLGLLGLATTQRRGAHDSADSSLALTTRS